VYHDKRAHEADLDAVIARAQAAGVQKFMVTGSDLDESRKAVELAKRYRKSLKAYSFVCDSLAAIVCKVLIVIYLSSWRLLRHRLRSSL